MTKYNDKMLVLEIRKMIEEKLDAGFEKFIIYPYGTIGMKVKEVLNFVYELKETYILDDHISRYNPRVKPVKFLEEINLGGG